MSTNKSSEDLKDTKSSGDLKDTKSGGDLKDTKSGGDLKDTKSDEDLKDTKSDEDLKDTKTDTESAAVGLTKNLISPESKMADEKGGGEREKWTGYGRHVPIPFIEDYASFDTWTRCVTAWSVTSQIPKKEQGYHLAQDLPIESKKYGPTLREDVYRHCPPDELVNDEKGVHKILEFLKSRYYVDREQDIYDTHANIKVIHRKKGQSLMDYIIEFDKLYTKAKQLKILPTGKEYDMCLALDLMVTSDLTSYEFMLIRSVANLLTEDGKRYETVKQKMRDILGKGEGQLKSVKDEVLLAQKDSKNDDDIDQVYLSKGWKPPPTQNNRYQNNQNGKNRYQNNNGQNQRRNGTSNGNNKTYIRKRQTNPIGKNGKPMQCLCCKSELHFIKECPDAFEKQDKNKPKYKTAFVVNSSNPETAEEIQLPISDTESEQEKEGDVFCTVYCSESQEDLNRFTAEALNKAALDTCCTASIAGEKWLKVYINGLPKDLKQKVKGPLPSQKRFMFGNQGKLKSQAKYIIPAKIGGEYNEIEMDVIQSDIPLLLSKGEMKKLGIVLDMKNDTGLINGKPLILSTTTAGHYVVDLLHHKEELEQVNIAELDEGDESTQMKALRKIHLQFGHRPKHQFVTILKEAGKWQEQFSKMIDRIMERCEGCILRSRTPDRPAVAPPLANDFGQVLGMDLKIWDKNKGIYILYMIDIFTRYQVATVIKSKEASEVVKAFTTKWLPIFGRVDKIITDNGSEFQNDEMREVASALNVQLLSTGANSPWSNGTTESNHGTTDRVAVAVKRDFPNMPLEVALAWAVTAVNSMSSVRGFSPYQLVFGKNIKLPNILEDPPPAWEEPQKSKELIDTLNAIHAARVEYTKAERCERLKRALKAKIRIADTLYEKGDICYFKKEGEDTWRGPAKVVFQDGKVIFIRIGSIYYRVSANRLKKAGESLANDIRAKEATENNEVHNEETIQTVKTRRQTIEEGEPDWHRLKIAEKDTKDTNHEEITIQEGDDNTLPFIENNDNNEPTGEQERQDSITKGRKRKKTNQKPTPDFNEDGTIKNAAQVLKRNDRIEIYENGKWEKGIVLGHGGKVGGKHSGWYNIQLDNGEVFHDEMSKRDIRYEGNEDQNEQEEEDVLVNIKLDCGKMIEVKSSDQRKIWYEKEEEQFALLVTEEILAVMVPIEQRNSPECMTAKLEELNKLIAFDTYKIVKDEGQERITTTWVLTEKGSEKRARLTARGFQEETTFPTDSPTVQKHSMRLLLTIAATEGWDIRTTDISSAFLQGSQMDRDVYVKPPKEANQAGWLWLLNKCLYGLKDASRKWYLRVVEKLKELGFETSKYDSGLFFLIKNGELIGIVALHVDDFLHCGNQFFNATILPQLLGTFKVGKSESRQFMYTGFYLEQTANGIRIDQNKYVRNVTIPLIDVKQMKDKERDMNQDELSLLRQITGIVNWTARATRPDTSFEMIDLSTKFKGGKVSDLIKAKNVAARLKKEEVTIQISNLKDFKDCEIIVYTDAAYRNLNDNTDSCGGYIIFIVNLKNGMVAPLEWKSNKLKRRVLSTLGAETQALYNGLDAALGMKLLLKELYGGKVDLKVRAITDNHSARTAIYSESEVTERVLRGDIAVIKQLIETGQVAEVKWVTGKDMLADILTKKGVNRMPLLEVLESGRMNPDTLQLIKA